MPRSLRTSRRTNIAPFLIGGVCIVAAVLIVMSMGHRGSAIGLKDPVQTEASGGTKMSLNGYDLQITYLYSYDITALVVHTKNYGSNSIGDKLSPKDLALAWGAVAEHNRDIDFHWRQSNRWYYWRVNNVGDLVPVGGEAGVSLHSANNHIVPANSAIRNAVRRIKTGDVVHLNGYLVNIDGTKAGGGTFTWHSSTSRTDTGSGACEVFYVTGVEIR